MRWNSENVSPLGPSEADGQRLLAVAKTGDAAKTNRVLTEIGQNPALAELVVLAVRAYGECELTERAAEGCQVTKLAADQLLYTLRQANPTTVAEAEKFAAKMEQCANEARQAAHKLEAARIAAVYRSGLRQRFGWLFGGPCGIINDMPPAAVYDKLTSLGIGDGSYPWALPTPEFKAPARPRREVHSSDTFREADQRKAGL